MCAFKHAQICINTNAKMFSKIPFAKQIMTSSKKFTFNFLEIAINSDESQIKHNLTCEA